VAELRQRINETADHLLAWEDLVPEMGVDGEATLAELTVEAVSELNQFEPCGTGNPSPTLVTRGLEVVQVAQVGNGSHLVLRVRSAAGGEESGGETEAVWFGRGGMLAGGEPLAAGARVDICHRPRLDEWTGSLRVRLHVKDVLLRGAG